MARPRSGTAYDEEKKLTLEICQEVKLMSRLSYADLEKKLNFDDLKGTQNGRNFARYCNADRTEGRVASRDTLGKIVKKSIEFGWLPEDYLSRQGKRREAAIPLNPKTTSAALFKERQNEVDQFLDRVRSLQNEVSRTISTIKGFQHLKVTTDPLSSWDDDGRSPSFWFGLFFLFDRQNPKGENAEYFPPTNLLEAVEWVNLHLKNIGFEFPDGLEAMPKISYSKTAKTRSNEKKQPALQVNSWIR